MITYWSRMNTHWLPLANKFKAIGQLSHAMLAITIKVCEIVKKIITKMDFRY